MTPRRLVSDGVEVEMEVVSTNHRGQVVLRLLVIQAVLLVVTWVIIRVNIPSDAVDLTRETGGAGHPPSRVPAHQVSKSLSERIPSS